MSYEDIDAIALKTLLDVSFDALQSRSRRRSWSATPGKTAIPNKLILMKVSSKST